MERLSIDPDGEAEYHRKVLEAVRARRKETDKRLRERMSGILPEQPGTAK